jgi:predicted SnoaL-like aldol condensation-catalyzing enzyme
MKKTKLAATVTFVLAATVGALLASQVQAQDPVVGVKDPESLFVDKDPALNKNKQAALRIMRELLQCNHWNDAGNWLTSRYIQHNPNAANGLDGVVTYFTKVAKREPTATCDKLTTPVVAVMAQGDLVTVVIPREYPHPTKAGEKYTTTWFDMWRFVDGKADEHWDPATIAAPAAK